jgi:ABC-type iron transport system FetAB ATPase subunit
MVSGTAYISAEESKRLQQQNKTVYVHSGLRFLKAHNGLRPGCVHTAMAEAGSGKSTLVRTIVRDFAFHPQNAGKKMVVWLSEESLEEFRTELSFTVPDHERLLDIKVYSETDCGNNLKGFMTEVIHGHAPDVFLFDNITTSALYDGKRVNEQNDFCRWIKNLTKQVGMATVLIAHTGAEVGSHLNRMITMNDIRGSKALVNLSEFFYIMQRFQTEHAIFTCLMVTKHRGQDIDNRMYKLNYEKILRAFKDDNPIDFKTFKEWYAKRNKL